MFIIKKLSNKSCEYTVWVQVVADIEATIQPQDAWSYQVILELLAQDFTQLYMVIDNNADINKQVVGYCLTQVIFEQAEILRIGTHPLYQRRGIAGQIFRVLHKEMQECRVESLLLEVRADNVPALALYQQQGFMIIHKRIGYYRHKDSSTDALIMQRVYVYDH